MHIRKATTADLPSILQIQEECYFEVPLEPSESFAAKLAISPETCFVAWCNDDIVGYATALPLPYGKIPKIGASKCFISTQADCLYIHDLAVGKRARSKGIGNLFVNAIFEQAQIIKFAQISLVAIQGASSYWAKFNFKTVVPTPDLQEQIRPYGDRATYMVAPVQVE